MNEVKYCEDCKHAVPHSWGSAILVCRRTPTDGRPDLVGRKPKVDYLRTCQYARENLQHSNKCGPDALLFEPKLPRKWWKIWG